MKWTTKLDSEVLSGSVQKYPTGPFMGFYSKASMAGYTGIIMES